MHVGAQFRADVADVRVDAQVVAGKHPLDGLTRDDFVIVDNGSPCKIEYFARESEPLSLLLLLDVSGSMQRSLELMARVAREALAALQPGDRVAIMVFGKRPELHREFSGDLAESARQISSAIGSHDVGAGTAINLAVLSAAKYIREHGAGRKAILIVTDNLSLSYQIGDRQVIHALYDADAVLNAMVIGRGIRPQPPKPGQYVNPDFTPADVFLLAEETGGEAVKADHPDITFREMVERIRNRYSLAYHAPGGEPGSLRRIYVTLAPAARRANPNAEVRARKGYYAP